MSRAAALSQLVRLPAADSDASTPRDRLREAAVRLRLRYRTWRACGRRHAAPISPAATLEVTPTAISRALSPAWREALEAATATHVQSVIGGDWDVEADRFVESPLFRAHRAAVVEGVPWTETTLADPDASVAPPPAPAPARPDADGGADPLAALETCYADVAARGYRSVRTRRRARRDRPGGPTAFDPYPDLPPAKGEIRVCVGRNGRFVLREGHHRLAIARLLGVDSVPVHASVRHPRWQARRDRVVLTGSGSGDHPDLRGLKS